MARKRLIAPAFFSHGALFDAEQESGLPLRVAYAGLWGHADRAGTFDWRPRELKLAILPYDAVNFADVLDALGAAGFVRRYTVGGKEYGVIPTLGRWQHFHKNEVKSERPAPPEHGANTVLTPFEHRASTPETDTEAVTDTKTESVAVSAKGSPLAFLPDWLAPSYAVWLAEAGPVNAGELERELGQLHALGIAPDHMAEGVGHYLKAKGDTRHWDWPKPIVAFVPHDFPSARGFATRWAFWDGRRPADLEAGL